MVHISPGERYLKGAAKELKTPGSPLFDMNERLKHIEKTRERTGILGDLVNTNLLLEIWQQHANLENRTDLRICNDWSLGYMDGPAEPPAPVITRVVIRAVNPAEPDAPGGNGETPPHKRTLH